MVVVDVALHPPDGRRALGRVRIQLLGDELELDAQGHESLLRAVVQVALDPAPLAVSDRRDPRTRPPELVQRRLELGDQAIVLERGQRVGAGSLYEQRVESAVVGDRREPSAVDLYLCHRTPSCGLGGAARPARLVDPVPAVPAQPVHDAQRPIGERRLQRSAQGVCVRVLAQLERDALERVGHEQALTQQPDREARGNERQREHVEPPDRLQKRRVGPRGAADLVDQPAPAARYAATAATGDQHPPHQRRGPACAPDQDGRHGAVDQHHEDLAQGAHHVAHECRIVVGQHERVAGHEVPQLAHGDGSGNWASSIVGR